MRKDGKSRRDIARSVGRQYSSIQRVIDNFKSTGIYTSKPRPGRPSNLTIRERRSMISLLEKNSRLTVAQIATDVHEKFNKSICADTARKILKKAGYRSRVARRKLYISVINRLKRIAFVKEHINKPPEFWRTIIFSDESKFCTFGI
ncbi:transposable element Tc1 transposase [Trichonephila clavipes]|nr:transposable element Tc1 transposase [Trichonephila clavipes]